MTESTQDPYKSPERIETWLTMHEPIFEHLRESTRSERQLRLASAILPLTDFDEIERPAGTNVIEAFRALEERVGPLGSLALRLAHSYMEDAYHVIVLPEDSVSEDLVPTSRTQ